MGEDRTTPHPLRTLSADLSNVASSGPALWRSPVTVICQLRSPPRGKRVSRARCGRAYSPFWSGVTRPTVGLQYKVRIGLPRVHSKARSLPRSQGTFQLRPYTEDSCHRYPSPKPCFATDDRMDSQKSTPPIHEFMIAGCR